MKSCPTCNRTFDDTLTFCLIDGSILSAPFDPKATLHLPDSDKIGAPPTEVIRDRQKIASLPLTQEEKQDASALPTIASATQPPPHLPRLPVERRLEPKRLIWILGGFLTILIIGVIAVTFAIRNSSSHGNINANNAQSNTSIASNTNPLSSNEVNRNSNSSTYKFTRKEFEEYKNYYVSEARKRGANIGAGADDLFTWAKILRSFDDARVDGINTIVIDVDEGRVTLRGGASSEAKSKAEQLVRGIEGVKGINNQIVVNVKD
jgi:hypothetical protein